jgi:hypothetical protein
VIPARFFATKASASPTISSLFSVAAFSSAEFTIWKGRQSGGDRLAPRCRPDRRQRLDVARAVDEAADDGVVAQVGEEAPHAAVERRLEDLRVALAEDRVGRVAVARQVDERAPRRLRRRVDQVGHLDQPVSSTARRRGSPRSRA